jgi:8-oxo-dGTP pyrophosphatase MutT (NUDIX family)
MCPNAFYRVSVKAFITNEHGRVLVVKENQDSWSLPGGGLDYGEDPLGGLRREIEEELGLVDIHIGELHQTITGELESKKIWLLWLVYNVTIKSDLFKLGDEVLEAAYIDPSILKDSDDIFEKLAFRVATSS